VLILTWPVILPSNINIRTYVGIMQPLILFQSQDSEIKINNGNETFIRDLVEILDGINAKLNYEILPYTQQTLGFSDFYQRRTGFYLFLKHKILRKSDFPLVL